MKKNKLINIKIIGLGGGGIKFMAVILAKILQDQGKRVSLYLIYDAAIRGGKIDADLIISNQQIDCPIITSIDYLIVLGKRELVYSQVKKIINAENNMFALGLILKELNVDINSIDLKKYLPEKDQDENIKNIYQGFNSQ